jgi:dienelactone hydrolase
MRYLDSLDFSRHLYEQQKPAFAFRAETRAEAEAWQGRLSEALVRLLGGFPSRRCPLNAEVVERKEFATYRRETVLFDSRERMTVFAYFLTPKELKSPAPCVLCIPGHGAGVDEICGIRPDGTVRDNRDGYQHDFALQCLDHGFTALAIEPLGFGHRRDEAARGRGPGASSCMPAAGAALLLGQCMIGWRLWDIIRGVDYLETRPEVDPKRLGLMGISGGGMMTLFGTALEPRIRACLVSGYFNTFRDSIFSLAHCIDNYVPGLLAAAEMPDVAGLIAPRPMFVESGTMDPIFPIAATRRSYEAAQRIWKVFGAEDRLGMEVFEGDHAFSGRQGFPFLREALGGGR